MKLGVVFPQTEIGSDPAVVRDYAQAAESAGYDHLLVFDHVLGGSVGIGEVATVPTSPAIANAIYNATGVRLTEIPVRPDRLIAALKGRLAA